MPYERCLEAGPACGGHLVDLDAKTVITFHYDGGAWWRREGGDKPESVSVRFVTIASPEQINADPSEPGYAIEPHPTWLPTRLELPRVKWLRDSGVVHRDTLYVIGTLVRASDAPHLLEIGKDGSVHEVEVPHRRVFDVASGGDALVLSLTRAGGKGSIARFDPDTRWLSAEMELPDEPDLAARCGPALLFMEGYVADVDGAKVYTEFDCVPDH